MGASPNTLWSLASRLRQYGGDVPMGLALTYIQNRYAQLIDQVSDGWSFQYRFGQFVCNPSIYGTCNVTLGSNLVTGCVPSGGVTSATLGSGGSGYHVADVLTLVGPGGAGNYATITVATLSGSAVATFTITTAGYNYVGGLATVFGGFGTGCTINITGTGNGALPGNRTTIVGRQALFNGMAPIFDIVDNGSGTQFTLSEAYGNKTQVGIAFEITNVYFTPSVQSNDFESMRVFTDPPYGTQYPFSFTFEEINNVDPQRSASGQPYLLADAGWNDQYLAALPSGVTDSLGYTNQSAPLPRKEAYPRQTTAYDYRYVYKRRMPPLTNPTDKPFGFIRGDVIFEGALADLALWEGTPVMPRRANPVVFNMHEKRFQQLVQDMQILDGSINQRTFTSILSMTRLPYPAAFWGSSFCQLRPWLTAGDAGVSSFLGEDF